MHEVTAVIIAFIFVGIVYPNLVKNLPLFYLALALALGVVLLDAVGQWSLGLHTFTYFLSGVLNVIAIVMLVMGTGGQTLGQLAGEMGKSIEAVRQSAAPAQPAAPAPVAAKAPAASAPAAAKAPTAAPQNAGPAAAPGAPTAAAPAAAAPAAPAKPRQIAMPPRKPREDNSIPMD